MNLKSIVVGFVIVLLVTPLITAQTIVDKTKGNHRYTKLGYMDGNLAETLFYNYGEIGDYTAVDKTRNGAWPKGSGHTYVDGIAVIVQAEVTTSGGQKVHPLESNYYEFTRML